MPICTHTCVWHSKCMYVTHACVTYEVHVSHAEICDIRSAYMSRIHAWHMKWLNGKKPYTRISLLHMKCTYVTNTCLTYEVYVCHASMHDIRSACMSRQQQQQRFICLTYGVYVCTHPCMTYEVHVCHEYMLDIWSLCMSRIHAWHTKCMYVDAWHKYLIHNT